MADVSILKDEKSVITLTKSQHHINKQMDIKYSYSDIGGIEVNLF